MEEARPQPYTITKKTVIADSAGVRVSEMTLDPGQAIPWHSHSAVTDTSYCLEGEMTVRLREPDEERRLAPGDSLAVPPGRPHTVANESSRRGRVLLIQATGPYDFLREPD